MYRRFDCVPEKFLLFDVLFVMLFSLDDKSRLLEVDIDPAGVGLGDSMVVSAVNRIRGLLDRVRVLVEAQLHVCSVGGVRFGEQGEYIFFGGAIACFVVVLGVVVSVGGVIVLAGNRRAFGSVGGRFTSFDFARSAGGGLG